MKILLTIILILILIPLATIATKQPAFFYNWLLSLQRDHPKIEEELNSSALPDNFSKDLSNLPKSVLGTFTDTIETKPRELKEAAKEELFQQAQQSLNTAFDKKVESSAPTVKIVAESTLKPEDITAVDLSQETLLKIKISRGSSYNLKFINIPQDTCLYIGADKYPITNQIVSLAFNSNGTYPIKTNLCNLNDRNLGEITVE
ncbi:MAG: hypothetical protein Q7S88_03700 [Candidatus Daviesbacteria bacterium]|nr:hypothetical protein [Candidatus Daviesbacteria bacterium]